MLVAFRSGVPASERRAIERRAGVRSARRLGPAVAPVGRGKGTGAAYLEPLELRVPATQVLAAVTRLRRHAAVAYAEPNYLQRGSAKPNDPSFPLQWGDENTGQAIPSQNSEEVLGAPENGTAGADDRAARAWQQTTGSRSIVIGEVDTGVDYTHPDLAANVWSNPGGIGGCAAGTHGYNVLAKTCNPLDEDTSYAGHGTHVAGIIGAVGNNGTGVAGINWQTSILPVKWMQNASSGGTSELIAAMQWLVAAEQAGVNVRVVNDSDTFVGTARSEALEKEIDTLGANNILFVTAAGNTGNNNNEVAVQRYPCSYDRPNELCVTASNNKDALPSWANYGSKTVDLAAPGVSVYSTLREGKYGYLSGGSMASPQVAGAAGLILAGEPSLSATALKARILASVDTLPSLSGKVISGGRLDVCKAISGCEAPVEATTIGKTNVGASKDNFGLQRKRVNRYALPTAGAVSKLSVYLEPQGTAGQQVLKGIAYADNAGAPGALLGTSQQLTFTSTSAAGWYDLTFASPLKLAAGNYWIGVITGATAHVAGFRWDSVTGSRDYNANTYASGPTDPFGAVTTDSEQTSLYATYTPPPVNKARPTISGTAQQGKTLTEAHGSWTNSPTSYAYQWQRCDSAGANCVAISGATAQAYVLVAADVGHTIAVQETASNVAGPGAAAGSAPSVVVAPPPAPVNTAVPTISGEARQGKTLTEAHGTWTNNPTGYSYQWQRCDSAGANCVAISGATGQAYVLTEADLGHTLRVQETASNEAGASLPASSTQTSEILPEPPANTAPPTITGTPQQGKTLTEAHGTWTNSPPGYSYQWQRCDSAGVNCSAISGATAQTYVLTAADVGHKLRVQETAANAGGSGTPAASAQTSEILPEPPANTAPPTITGTPQQGKTLTEAHGTWTNNPTGYSYQWQRCDSAGANCVAISGATGQAYVLTEADLGHTLRVQETASNEGGTSAAASSAATGEVLPEVPTITSPPTIGGSAQEGQTLTEVHGSWTNNPTSYSYQWQRCDSEGANCTAISGATAQAYVLVAADVGHTMRVQETASNAGGAGIAAGSAATEIVAAPPPPPPPVNTAPPTISGEARQGKTLTEHHGSWEHEPTSFAYQWLQCDALGSTCLPIASATGQTYQLTAADVGHTIAVLETAGNAGGASEPSTSTVTAAVVPSLLEAPTNTTPPTISGIAQQGKTLTESHGSWENEPTGYSYQWLRCDSSAKNCSTISEATGQSYLLTAADVGHTIIVQETASNATGESTPANSAPTAEVLPEAPANTAPPTITGTAQEGGTLTEVHGAWEHEPTSYSYQWQRCDSAGASCSAISGATAQTYLLLAADVGHALRVQETAHNAGGESAPAGSASTAVVLPLAPVNKTPPKITGSAREGQTVTEAHGSWTNSPTGYTYQWQRCDSAGANCTAISGATAQTYVLIAGDVGHTIRVQETASNEGGTGTPATSGRTAEILPLPPANTAPPTITGTAQQGKTLTEAHGSWTNSPTSFAYQWQRCDSAGANCTPISGATAQTYVLVAADIGHTIAVQETASNAGGPGSQTSSTATGVVAPPPAPVNTAAPTIGGEARQGKTLTEAHGSWKNEPTGFAYQWQRCEGTSCVAISGATAQTYALVAADVGHTMRVQETASNEGGASTPASSASTGEVRREVPVNSAPPTITGTAQQGQKLTEAHGTWTNSPTGYSFQWQRCDSTGANCTAISGATAQTYVLVAADVGHTIRVQETASNEGGSGIPARSAATGEVPKPVPVNSSPPTITGNTQQGQKLTEAHGTWTNSPTGYTYQWQRCDSAGANCTAISGATAQTYVLVVADAGHTIRVLETASNEVGAGAPASSAATAEVSEVPVNTALPTITGTSQQGKTLTELHGTWTNGPTGYSYQWQQCESSGSACLPISGATAQTYVLAAGDVGHTIRVQETASNAAGPSAPATSTATAAVTGAESATFGKTSIGASKDYFGFERKRVNKYALTVPGSVTKLSVYLEAHATGQQVLKGLIYTDNAGTPAALLGTSQQLTFASTSAAGWYDLTFASPVKLAAGTYWIGVLTGATNGVAGFRYDTVTGSRDYNTNTFATGPSNPFGAVTTDGEQTSLYATYTPG